MSYTSEVDVVHVKSGGYVKSGCLMAWQGAVGRDAGRERGGAGTSERSTFVFGEVRALHFCFWEHQSAPLISLARQSAPLLF